MYHIILSGTGPRYVSFIGSLSCLFKRYPSLLDKKTCNTNCNPLNYYKNIKTLSGSSGGSLIAMVLSLGYTINEMKNIGVKIGYNELTDLDITEFFTTYGIDSGKKFENMLKALIKFKYGKISLNFKQLYEYTGIKLIITATCLNRYKTVYFNYETTPNLELWKAVRMSASVPFLFAPVEYDGNLYTDGALVDFFPLHTINNNKADYKKEDQIIGIKLNDMSKNGDVDIPINNIVDFSTSLILALSTVIYDLREYYQYPVNTFENIDIISFNTAHINSLSFDITEDDRTLLYNIGYSSAMTYFEEKDKETESFCRDILETLVKETVETVETLVKKENNKNQQSLNLSDSDQ
tara:strand:- start:773 stop:1825 length:1053 start_codon:yes stop_codon:yes gene_type:complete